MLVCVVVRFSCGHIVVVIVVFIIFMCVCVCDGSCSLLNGGM